MPDVSKVSKWCCNCVYFDKDACNFIKPMKYPCTKCKKYSHWTTRPVEVTPRRINLLEKIKRKDK